MRFHGELPRLIPEAVGDKLEKPFWFHLQIVLRTVTSLNGCSRHTNGDLKTPVKVKLPMSDRMRMKYSAMKKTLKNHDKHYNLKCTVAARGWEPAHWPLTTDQSVFTSLLTAVGRTAHTQDSVIPEIEVLQL